jgi:organic radical activating enzyme
VKTPLSFERAAKPARSGCLKVTEHYLCEEGEGRTLGALTYLVRLSGCNLRCWWCDSKQSSFYDDEEKMVPAERIFRDAMKSGASWVSFTGGEPAWRSQAELKTLARLCIRLKKSGKRIKIETNGLQDPVELKKAFDLWSVAPKWDSLKQGQTRAMNYDIKVLKALAERLGAGAMQLKFVIDLGREGLAEPARILKALASGPKPPVFFIPQAYGAGNYLERCKKLASLVRVLAKKVRGWDLRVQPQWHRVLYGDARGV